MKNIRRDAYVDLSIYTVKKFEKKIYSDFVITNIRLKSGWKKLNTTSLIELIINLEDEIRNEGHHLGVLTSDNGSEAYGTIINLLKDEIIERVKK